MTEFPTQRSFVQAAKDAVNEAGFLFDDMEFFPAAHMSPQELDTERLLACDIYVGLLGFKYGSTVREQPDLSYTQHEFLTAQKHGKTLLVFLLVFLLDEQAELPGVMFLDPEYGERQRAFRSEVLNLDGKGLVCQRFSNADELQRLLIRALRHLRDKGKPTEQGTDDAAAQFDAALEAYSARQLTQWQACLRGEDDRHDRLDHYVEPHYSLLKPDSQFDLTGDRLGRQHRDNPQADQRFGYEPVAAEGDDAETELAKLLSVTSRLCLAEDAGAGKSVFTRRVLALACSGPGREALLGGRPCLAVRWEQWENDWPSDFELALTNAIADECARSSVPVSPEDLVAWALREGRVLLILDGLDQVASDNTVRCVAAFLSGNGRNCRVVVTGRTYKVDGYRTTLFRASEWRLARIEGFDDQQRLGNILPRSN